MRFKWLNEVCWCAPKAWASGRVPSLLRHCQHRSSIWQLFPNINCNASRIIAQTL